MNFKVFSKGNYIIVEDVVNGNLYEGLRKDVRILRVENDSNYFSFVGLANDNEITINIINIKKEDGSDYSLNEWIDFYTTNTGNFNGGGSAPDLSITNKWKKEQLSGFTYNINIDSNELSYYELYFVKDDRSKDFSDPNFEVTNNSITINSGFPLDGVVCFYRKIEL